MIPLPINLFQTGLMRATRLTFRIPWTQEDRVSLSTVKDGGVSNAIDYPLPCDLACLGTDKLYFLGFLGPSSTWAYTRQVIVEIQKYVGQHPESPELPLHVDGNAYQYDRSVARTTTLTKRELPSLDHALYLINTVKFHFAQLYHLFDEDLFIDGLHRYYSATAPQSTNLRLWFIQYLVVMAFGKAFLVQKTPGEPLPGAVFFAEAIKLIPDINGLYEDTLLSIEILCGIALYLQCIDHRNNAYVYVSESQKLPSRKVVL